MTNDYSAYTADLLNTPDWKGDGFEVEFTFRNGAKKSVSINTDGLTPSEIQEVKNQLLGKMKLVQTIFDRGTHGQITVQGVTVRADELIAVKLR